MDFVIGTLGLRPPANADAPPLTDAPPPLTDAPPPLADAPPLTDAPPLVDAPLPLADAPPLVDPPPLEVVAVLLPPLLPPPLLAVLEKKENPQRPEIHRHNRKRTLPGAKGAAAVSWNTLPLSLQETLKLDTFGC